MSKIEELVAKEIDERLHGDTQTFCRHCYDSEYYIETRNNDIKNDIDATHVGINHSVKNFVFRDVIEFHINYCNKVFK